MSAWLPRRSTRTRVIIRANGEQVWRALVDLAGHARWNPALRLQPWRGTVLREGERAWLRLRLFSIPLVVPIIVEVVALQQQLRWRGGPLGLLSGRHFFELRAGPEPGTTELVHGEDFEGLLLPLLWPVLAGELERLYREINTALAAYVEG